MYTIRIRKLEIDIQKLYLYKESPRTRRLYIENKYVNEISIQKL